MKAWWGWGVQRRARQALKQDTDMLKKLYKRARKRLGVAVCEEIESVLSQARVALKSRDMHLYAEASTHIQACVQAHLKAYQRPAWRENIESILWAVLVALALRAFVVEAFRIPSGSMIPTLSIGDQIFVNKLIYGVRVPFTSIRLLNFSEPKRADVVVFIAPEKPHHDYIKRVVGVPGDTVELKQGRLWVNGVAVPREALGTSSHWERDLQTHEWRAFSAQGYQETVDGRVYTVLQDVPEGYTSPDFPPFVVPKNALFVMGDNRDHSYDSRYWGVVPMSSVLGKAMFIWWSWGHEGLDVKRLGRWLR